VLLDWAPDGATLLLFAGEGLKNQLDGYEAFLIPESEKRYLLRGRNKKQN
jgi:hypothetical protein